MCPDLGRGFTNGNTLGQLRRGSGLSVTRAYRCLFCSPWPFARPYGGRGEDEREESDHTPEVAAAARSDMHWE